MNVNLSSLALASVGTYATISGYRDLKSQDKSNGWAMAKTALGVAILASQVDFALNGNGLVNRILDAFSSCDRISTSELNSVHQRLRDLEINAGNLPGGKAVTNIFQVLKNTKGVTCQNYLPWQDEWKEIPPKALDQSVMWGMDSAKKLFVAIRHTCKDGSLNRLSVYAQRVLGRGETVEAVKGYYHDDKCMPRFIVPYMNEWVTKLIQDGTAKVPLNVLRDWPCWSSSSNCTGRFQEVLLT